MGIREYLISKIPKELVEKWNLSETPKDEIETPINHKKTPIATNFRLPITYLDSSEVYSLSPIISQDLELYIPDSESSIYDHLFLPTSSFGRNIIQEWTKHYTTNTQFLKDTQTLISKMHMIPKNGSRCFPHYEGFSKPSLDITVQNNDVISSEYIPDYDNFREMWRDLKEDKFFLEKYGFMEWSILEHFNENASFLQCLSFVNVISPLISLLLPLIFIILPFIILKIQQIPINFTVYLDVLRSIARNHFIGKALMNMSSFSWDKVAYLLMTASLYFLQIYQNVSICYRFYRNMILVNKHLVEMREFVNRSINKMDILLDILSKFNTYSDFRNNLLVQYNILTEINQELSHINPFENSILKFGESGYMLRCYYRLHSDSRYEEAIRYSIGFEGYIENLHGVYANLSSGKISAAEFTTDASGCTLVEQCYPSLVNQEYVALNSVEFNKNMILSGPNGSGKTTLLKTTALNIIFSQQLGCGFYSSALLCPYTHIHSYLNIPDTSGRDSLFQAESRRCKDILDHIKKAPSGSRHFCIFDELYSGTNPEEATKAGYAFLKYLTNFDNVNFMLTTHYVKICKKFLKSDRVQNYKMYVRLLERGGCNYTFKMEKGISKIKGAILVMKDMDYPEEILQGMK
jgi:hypothetical protein